MAIDKGLHVGAKRPIFLTVVLTATVKKTVAFGDDLF